MRIVLLYPDQPMDGTRPEPLGVQYLAQAVRDEHQVHIIDGFGRRLTAESMVDKCVDLNPDLIGISTPHNPQVPQGRDCVKLIGERIPGVPIVWGGNYPTYHARDFVKRAVADYVVKHEGDKTFAALVQALTDGGDLNQIPGLCFRDRITGDIVDTGKPDLIPDLCELPVLRHDLPEYPDPYTSFAIAASRGCPFNCSNCSTSAYWLHRRRQRPVPHVMDEINSLIDRHGKRPIVFIDDLFTGKFFWVEQLCAEIISTYGRNGIRWVCNTRLDFLTEDLIRDMSDAGLHRVFLGIESGSDRILNKLKKRYTAKQALDTLMCMRDHGIVPNVSLMMGLPWETKEDLQLTVDFIEQATKLVPQGLFSIKHVTPMHGTKLYEDRQQFGVQILEDDQFNLDLLSARVETNHLTRKDINAAFFTGRIMIDQARKNRSSRGDC